MSVASARCPVRPGEPCTLCQVDVTGPQDCGLVYLVMSDEELRRWLRGPGPARGPVDPRGPGR